MTQTKKINRLSINEIRKTLGFNKHVTCIKLNGSDRITFKFLDYSHRNQREKELNIFEMREHDCDYGAFDEFAYRCIDNFDSENLSDNEIIERSKQVYL